LLRLQIDFEVKPNIHWQLKYNTISDKKVKKYLLLIFQCVYNHISAYEMKFFLRQFNWKWIWWRWCWCSATFSRKQLFLNEPNRIKNPSFLFICLSNVSLSLSLSNIHTRTYFLSQAQILCLSLSLFFFHSLSLSLSC